MYGDYEDKEFFRELATKAGVENLPWIKKAINSTLFLQRPKNRQRLLKFLSIKIQKNVKQDHPFLPAPPKEQISQGDYTFCKVVTGRGPEYAAKVDKNIASEHGIIVGPSGAGKTTWLVHTGKQIHRMGLNPETGKRDIAVWLFCTEGQIAAYIAASSATGCEDFLIIDVPRVFRFNRYKAPPGVDQKEHISKLINQDRECKYYRDYLANKVKDACFELINRLGTFNERQLLEHIASKKFKPGTREFASQESISNRLRESLEYMGSVYDTARSHDLAALTGRSVVWMLHGLSSDHIATFVGDLMLWLKEYMPVWYEPKLKLVIIMDEFTHICDIDRCKRADIQEPYVLDATRIFRKRAISLVLGTQSIYTVPSVVLSNISCFWLIYRPLGGKSMRVFSRNLLLSPDKARYMMEMPDRYIVCRIKTYRKAFLGDVGEINLPVATDEEIATRIEETKRVLDSLLEPQREEPSLFSQKPTAEQAETLFGYYKLTKATLDYLEFLAEPQHALLPLGELDRLDSLSDYKARDIRQQLIDTGPGLIRIHQIKVGKKGAPLSVVEITEAGYHLLAKLGLKCDPPVGHGSLEHKFWQWTIFRSLINSHQAQIEKWLNGKSVDVAVEWDEKKCAIEIALEDMEKELNNLVRDLEAGWDRIVFCAITEKEINRLRNEIGKRFESKLLTTGKVAFVKLSTLWEFEEGRKKTDAQFENQHPLEQVLGR